MPVHQRVMTVLEDRGLLDREIEFLPRTSRSVSASSRVGAEFAGTVGVLAWSKIALTDDLMATSVDTDGWALDALPSTSRRTCRHGTAIDWANTRCAKRSS